MKKKVLLGMSGGVDSSVSAYLLKEQGYEVCGLTMCLGVKDIPDDDSSKCCGTQAISDAKKVCGKLGIKHFVMTYSDELEKYVIENFVSEYLRGRTPNPCVLCNKYLKFGKMFEKAMIMGFDFLATGHYAHIVSKNNIKFLKKAKDSNKDQTYFLYAIQPHSLDKIIFPLADYNKDEIKKIAEEQGLVRAAKPESQDICFIPNDDYHEFILKREKNIKSGKIVYVNGDILGVHKGIPFYTIGQRRGLGIGWKEPLYVTGFDIKNNYVIVGEEEYLFSKGLIAQDLNIFSDIFFHEKLYAKIRYNSEPKPCVIEKEKENLKVIFDKRQRAVTPGQSIVFYDENGCVLAGGIIQF